MTTKEAYFDEKKSQYCISRALFHDSIVTITDKICEGYRELAVEDQKKQIVFIGGGSGVGKTTTITQLPIYDEIKKFNNVDADQIKALLPEYYCEDLNRRFADKVHDESSDLSAKMLKCYQKLERKIVYDGTMKNTDKYRKLIKEFYDNGYEITVIFIDCELPTAYRRVAYRERDTGREVETEIIRDSNYLSAKTLITLLQEFDHEIANVLIINSSCDKRELVCSKSIDKVGITILKQDLYNEILLKSNTDNKNFMTIHDMIRLSKNTKGGKA